MRAQAVSPFETENVRAFAEAWYRALDLHVPTEECLKLLADQGLEMVFPEKTLVGLADFASWYAGGSYSDGSSGPGVINIFFDEVHTVQSVEVEATSDEATAVVVVGWQASWFQRPEPKCRRTSMNAMQQWRLQPAAAGKNPYGLEIVGYNAQLSPFEYAPGFARL